MENMKNILGDMEMGLTDINRSSKKGDYWEWGEATFKVLKAENFQNTN